MTDCGGKWRYSLELVTGPTEEPVSIDEARAQCEVFHNDSDLRLLRLIRTARRMAETYMDRQLCTASWRLRADSFPFCTETNPFGSIYLPRPKLSAVTSVTYADADGTSTTFSSANYIVETPTRGQGRINLVYGVSWPSTQVQPNAVTILYDAGYGGASAVPEPIKDGILGLVDFLNEQRGDETADIPKYIKNLFDSESWGSGL